MTRLQHFYHIGAEGYWRQPVQQHLDAIRRSGFPGQVTVGVTGDERPSELVAIWLKENWPDAQCVLLPGEYERPTLQMLYSWAGAHPDTLIMYAHTKGIFNRSQAAEAWRESMTIDVVDGWRRCVQALESGEYDAAGPHWLTPVEYPNMLIAVQRHGGSETPYFGGNFWWATGSYLAKLPAPDFRTRWDAERWIGLNNPRVLNLRPGWPVIITFAGAAATMLLQMDWDDDGD